MCHYALHTAYIRSIRQLIHLTIKNENRNDSRRSRQSIIRCIAVAGEIHQARKC